MFLRVIVRKCCTLHRTVLIIFLPNLQTVITAQEFQMLSFEGEWGNIVICMSECLSACISQKLSRFH